MREAASSLRPLLDLAGEVGRKLGRLMSSGGHEHRAAAIGDQQVQQGGAVAATADVPQLGRDDAATVCKGAGTLQQVGRKVRSLDPSPGVVGALEAHPATGTTADEHHGRGVSAPDRTLHHRESERDLPALAVAPHSDRLAGDDVRCVLPQIDVQASVLATEPGTDLVDSTFDPVGSGLGR